MIHRFLSFTQKLCYLRFCIYICYGILESKLLLSGKKHNQWMEQEKQMLADQYKQQEVLWQKQSHRLTDIVRNNEGVWLSQRLFYIIGSLSLLSIITIVLEIAFYVYFHWIQ